MLGHLKNSRGEATNSRDEIRIARNNLNQNSPLSKAVKTLKDRISQNKFLGLKEKSLDVLALQDLLEKLNLITTKNGVYDWKTRLALRKFQRRNKLGINGRLDSKTLDLLQEKAGVKDYVAPESKPEPVAQPSANPVSPAPVASRPRPTVSTPRPTAPSTPRPAVTTSKPKPAANVPNQKGKVLAAAAARVARRRNTFGRCYAGVADAVDHAIGRFLWGASAYMAADQLAKHPEFKEIKASGPALKTLPPGAIIVWRKTAASPNGHISVSLGDGREASDHIAPQRSSLRGDTRPRVFIVK